MGYEWTSLNMSGGVAPKRASLNMSGGSSPQASKFEQVWGRGVPVWVVEGDKVESTNEQVLDESMWLHINLLLVDRQTDTTENVSFPQTTYTCGKIVAKDILVKESHVKIWINFVTHCSSQNDVCKSLN